MTKGTLHNIREALAQCIDNLHGSKYQTEPYEQALAELDALMASVKEIDEDHKDHVWFKHGDGMDSFLHSEAVLSDINERKAKILSNAMEVGDE